MTVLVIAEKPSAARDFADALGGMEGSFSGTPYKIVALAGHVMGLAEPSEQVPAEEAERFASWDAVLLPWDLSKVAFRRVVEPGKERVLANLRSELSKLGASDEACIATDLDPSGEGNLIAWEVLLECGVDGTDVPVTRMAFIDQSADSVREAFQARKRIASADADGDFRKADARDRFDWASMQLTRAATFAARSRGHKAVVRQGRLKSVMVYEVGRQLDAYSSHKKVPFFEPRFKDSEGNSFAPVPELAEKLRKPAPDAVDMAPYASAPVAIDSERAATTPPPKLPDLAALSVALGKQGFPASEVKDTYQALYEDQWLSYPRTEDKTITPAQFAELAANADAIASAIGVDPALLSHREPRAGHVKPEGAHGANRPGPKVPSGKPDLERYGKCAWPLYELVARRALAMLAPDAAHTRIKAHVVGYEGFSCEIDVPGSPGWREVADDGSGPKGTCFGDIAKPYVFEGSNTRPQRPTWEWLVKRMERHSVGTGATRVAAFEAITEAGPASLVKEDKGKLALTECGAISYMLLEGCQIADMAVTEELFAEMERIAEGTANASGLLRRIGEIVEHDRDVMMANAPKLPQGAGTARKAIGKCPRCGRDAVLAGAVARCSASKPVKAEDGTWEDAGECTWKLIAKVSGKQLTASQVSEVLAKGITSKPVCGLKSKEGKTFKARLALDDSKERLRFVFDGGAKRSRA